MTVRCTTTRATSGCSRRTILPDSHESHWIDIDRKLLRSRELIAFGITTRSGLLARRDWVVYDGFLDSGLLHVMLKMFWYEKQFYLLNVTDCGRGKLVFHTDIAEYVPTGDKPMLTFDQEKNMSIAYPGFRLTIPGDLRSLDLDEIRDRGNLAGWIEYRRNGGSSMAVGALERTE